MSGLAWLCTGDGFAPQVEAGGTKKSEQALGILGWTGLWEKASMGPWVQGELAL